VVWLAAALCALVAYPLFPKPVKSVTLVARVS